MPEYLNIILTENLTSFKMALPFKASLPYIFDHEIKHLVSNLTHKRFSNLFLSSPDQNVAEKFNSRYESIFLSVTAAPTQAFKNIVTDIERINYPQNSVVDLLINADVFDKFNELNQICWVDIINTLASDKKIFINLFIFGDSVDKQILSQATANSTQIHSLSVITVLDSNSLSQQVLFSHSKTGVINNQTQEHTQVNNAYQTNNVSSKNQHNTDRKSIQKIYTIKELFTPEEFPPGYFHVLDGFDDVFASIPQNIASTVILPCEKYMDIENLAHLAYRLRKNCNTESKLIVREMNQCIRYSDEQFLLHSGVSLVIPVGVPVSRILGQITAIQNHVYNVQLPSSAKSLTALRSRLDFQGHYQASEFCSVMLETITEHNRINVEYALIRLDIISGIPASECVKLCQIKRNGDIYTAFNDAIYIFLSDIRSNDIAPVLNNIFGLNVLEYFSQYEIFNTYSLVHDEIMLMKGKKELSLQNSLTPDHGELKLAEDQHQQHEQHEQFLFARKIPFSRSCSRG